MYLIYQPLSLPRKFSPFTFLWLLPYLNCFCRGCAFYLLRFLPPFLSSRAGFVNYSLQPKSSAVPVFVNKAVLEGSRTHLLKSFQSLLSCCNGRVESLQQRPYGTQSQKYLLSGP